MYNYTIKSTYTVKKAKTAFLKSLAFLAFHAIAFGLILPFTLMLVFNGRYPLINITFGLVSTLQLVQIVIALKDVIVKWKNI